MGKNRARWLKNLLGILAYATTLLVSSVGGGRKDEATTVTAPNSRCINNKSYMLISTLDGRLSALDLKKQGALVWSVQADIRPLLSSSLENLEVIQDGKTARLLPSLDGGLYQFDGTRIVPLPQTAETLLSSSSRLNDDTMMIGGKDIKTYGIDVKTGKVRYVCTATGCQYCGSTDVSMEDLVVVTRSTNTVRAVDARTGMEKWNFSVGQHEVRYMPSAGRDAETASKQDDDVDIVICPNDDELEEESYSNILGENYKNTLRFSVPNGNIVALNPENPTKVKWEHKFSSAIANVWLLRGDKFETLDLFERRYNPALLNFPYNEDVPTESLLYLGYFRSQQYVQVSSQFQKSMPNLSAASSQSGAVARIAPKVSWRPYLSRADAHTPMLRGNYGNNPDQQNGDSDERSLIVWTEEYPFDNGYYLYPEFKPKMQIDVVSENKTMPGSSVPTWKQLLVVTLGLGIWIPYVLHRYTARKLEIEASKEKQPEKSNSSNSSGLPASKSDFDLTEPLKPEAEFKSRFAQEFEMIHCLGKGGFGVVFEAKNRMDDCNYAVKRIALPNREDAREKMMREVKALAKLDHAGIVRYFHAWLETPPGGWQQDWDSQFTDSELLSRTPCNSGADPTESALTDKKALIKPLPPRETVPLGLFLEENLLGSTGGLSGGFSAHSADSTDESGSFSLGVGEEPGPHGDASLPASQTRARSAAGSASMPVEFSSDSIVFEDEDPSSSGGVAFRDDDSSNCADCAAVSGKASRTRRSLTPNRSHSAVVDRQKLGIIPQTSFSLDSTSSYADNQTDTSLSSSIVFRDDLASSEGDTSSAGMLSGSRGLPFQHYHNSGSLSRSPQDSFSVVFEDSGCRDRSSNEGGSGDGGGQDPSDSGGRNAGERERNDHVVQMEGSSRREQGKKPGLGSIPKAYLYIQMQLCRRETLKDWLSANVVRDEFVLDIFDQIVSAVEYVHFQGLMHRDLKPSNIFFSMDGAVKIGDFGLVTALTEQQDEAGSGGQEVQQKHTAEVGTQLYMSPEQIAKKPYDFKVDIFSLGMILYELLVPFETQMERIRCLQNAKRLNFPLTFQNERPDEFEFVQRLLSHDPGKRPTAQQILDSPLLEAFGPRRVSRRFRTRTISNSSNSSDKLSESQDS